jgi:hypothetical protein
LTVDTIKHRFPTWKEVSELYLKIPVGIGNEDTLPITWPISGYIAIGVEDDELQWLDSSGEKGLVMGGEAPPTPVTNRYMPGGW